MITKVYFVEGMSQFPAACNDDGFPDTDMNVEEHTHNETTACGYVYITTILF